MQLTNAQNVAKILDSCTKKQRNGQDDTSSRLETKALSSDQSPCPEHNATADQAPLVDPHCHCAHSCNSQRLSSMTLCGRSIPRSHVCLFVRLALSGLLSVLTSPHTLATGGEAARANHNVGWAAAGAFWSGACLGSAAWQRSSREGWAAVPDRLAVGPGHE